MSTLSEKIKKINNSIYLTEEEHEKMDNAITNFMDAHPLEKNDMIKSEKKYFHFSFPTTWGKRLAFAIIIIAIIFSTGSGVVLASQEALPGDFLYGVKINVSEEIKSALIFSTKEKANWEADRLELRLKEMQQVVAKTGFLSSVLVKDTEQRVMDQTAKVASAARDLEKMGDTESIYKILDRIQTSLDSYNNILQGLLAQNPSVNTSDIQKITEQVQVTEQNIKLVQQQTVDKINEVTYEPVVAQPETQMILFSTPNKYTRVKVGEQLKVTWNTSGIEKNTFAKISLWTPSGQKRTDLFTASDITNNQVYWDVKDVLPGTWRLRIDLNNGKYWFSDVFVIEQTNNFTLTLPDLQINNLTLSNYEPLTGERVEINFLVANNSNKNYEAKHTFGVEIRSDGLAINGEIISDSCASSPIIDVEQNCVVKSFFTPTKPGIYIIKAFTEYQDYAPEVNQNNNYREIKINVSDNQSTNNQKRMIFSGHIKEFTDGGFGNFSQYVELTDGTKIALKICDQRMTGMDKLIHNSTISGAEVDVYGYSTDGGLCVNGLIVDVGTTPNKYFGYIKNLTSPYGDFGQYIETLNGVQVGVTICDKRVIGMQELINTTVISGLQTYVYGSSINGGICVNGMVVQI